MPRRGLNFVPSHTIPATWIECPWRSQRLHPRLIARWSPMRGAPESGSARRVNRRRETSRFQRSGGRVCWHSPSRPRVRAPRWPLRSAIEPPKLLDTRPRGWLACSPNSVLTFSPICPIRRPAAGCLPIGPTLAGLISGSRGGRTQSARSLSSGLTLRLSKRGIMRRATDDFTPRRGDGETVNVRTARKATALRAANPRTSRMSLFCALGPARMAISACQKGEYRPIMPFRHRVPALRVRANRLSSRGKLRPSRSPGVRGSSRRTTVPSPAQEA